MVVSPAPVSLRAMYRRRANVLLSQTRVTSVVRWGLCWKPRGDRDESVRQQVVGQVEAAVERIQAGGGESDLGAVLLDVEIDVERRDPRRGGG
jgi:hypothetical protein